MASGCRLLRHHRGLQANFLVAAATLVRPRYGSAESGTCRKPGIPRVHLWAPIVRPELVRSERGQAEHVRRYGNVGERELIAHNPRPAIESAFQIIEEVLDRLPRLRKLVVRYLAANRAGVNVLVILHRASRGLFRQLLDAPTVLELGKDVLDHRQLHDRVEAILALPNKLAHPRLSERIGRYELWTFESGVDIFVNDRGFAN